MRKLFAALILGVSTLLTGCLGYAGSPVVAGIYTATKGPAQVVDNSVQPANMGTSEANGILIIATGDASIKKAMENGSITRIHHWDTEVFSILGLYVNYKTVVYGE